MADLFEGKQGNLVDEKLVSRKRQRRVNDDNIRSLVLRTLMGESNGRRFVWTLLEECNVYSSSLRMGVGGYAATAFLEGQRAIGLKLVIDLTRLCPKEYLSMTIENTSVEMEMEDGGSRDDSND